MIRVEMISQSSHQEEGKEHLSHSEAREHFPLTVRQPEKITSLLAVLSDLEKISERVSEDRSQDLGAGARAGMGDDSSTRDASQSARKQALQSLPSKEVMQRKLVSHLKGEVRHLEREARRLARSGKQGAAFLLTQTYARIRKIQSLIEELLGAAREVIERLYVRLFIDKQQLV